jgi:hypothetical protein
MLSGCVEERCRTGASDKPATRGMMLVEEWGGGGERWVVKRRCGAVLQREVIPGAPYARVRDAAALRRGALGNSPNSRRAASDLH